MLVVVTGTVALYVPATQGVHVPPEAAAQYWPATHAEQPPATCCTSQSAQRNVTNKTCSMSTVRLAPATHCRGLKSAFSSLSVQLPMADTAKGRNPDPKPGTASVRLINARECAVARCCPPHWPGNQPSVENGTDRVGKNMKNGSLKRRCRRSQQH